MRWENKIYVAPVPSLGIEKRLLLDKATYDFSAFMPEELKTAEDLRELSEGCYYELPFLGFDSAHEFKSNDLNQQQRYRRSFFDEYADEPRLSDVVSRKFIDCIAHVVLLGRELGEPWELYHSDVRGKKSRHAILAREQDGMFFRIDTTLLDKYYPFVMTPDDFHASHHRVELH